MDWISGIVQVLPVQYKDVFFGMDQISGSVKITFGSGHYLWMNRISGIVKVLPLKYTGWMSSVTKKTGLVDNFILVRILRLTGYSTPLPLDIQLLEMTGYPAESVSVPILYIVQSLRQLKQYNNNYRLRLSCKVWLIWKMLKINQSYS